METLSLTLQLFMWRTSIKYYHWNTESYSRHVATCTFLDAFDTFVDSFTEKYIARYGRPTFGSAKTVAVVPINDGDAVSIMKQMVVYLQKDLPKYVKQSDTDLLNLRDDILGVLQNTIYLFTLN